MIKKSPAAASSANSVKPVIIDASKFVFVTAAEPNLAVVTAPSLILTVVTAEL